MMSPGVAKASAPTFKAEPFTMLIAGFSMIDKPASTVNTFGVPTVKVIDPDLPSVPASESKREGQDGNFDSKESSRQYR